MCRKSWLPKLITRDASALQICIFRRHPPTKAVATSANTESIHIRPKNSTKAAKMHLMYTLDPNGKRNYTLKKVTDGEVTKSAHPARFSPDDKYSR